MSTEYITFAHLESESTDDYYLALPGYYSIEDEADCDQVKQIAAGLTGEDEDLLYVECLAPVSLGLGKDTLL